MAGWTAAQPASLLQLPAGLTELLLHQGEPSQSMGIKHACLALALEGASHMRRQGKGSRSALAQH